MRPMCPKFLTHAIKFQINSSIKAGKINRNKLQTLYAYNLNATSHPKNKRENTNIRRPK